MFGSILHRRPVRVAQATRATGALSDRTFSCMTAVVARYAARIAALVVAAFGLLLLASQPLFGAGQDPLDAQLRSRLAQLGFTGDVESTLETRLGRRVDPRLANIGRLLWFDTVTGLHGDNS